MAYLKFLPIATIFLPVVRNVRALDILNAVKINFTQRHFNKGYFVCHILPFKTVQGITKTEGKSIC